MTGTTRAGLARCVEWLSALLNRRASAPRGSPDTAQSTKKIEHFEIPVPSTALIDSHLVEDGVVTTLWYRYERDGAIIEEGIEFTRVRAHRFRAEVHCKTWHLQGYDALIEIPDSEWAAEIRSETASGWKDHWTLNHYMIYLDTSGSYELLAESWKPVSRPAT